MISKYKKKLLSIQFINDINSVNRFIIDQISGFKILINLNNPIVKYHLSNTTDSHQPNSFRSLYFMAELMCDIFTDIIINNDINQIENDTYVAKKILERRKEIQTKIEKNIYELFGKYIQKKHDTMMNSMANHFSLSREKLLQLALENQGIETIENASLDFQNVILDQFDKIF